MVLAGGCLEGATPDFHTANCNEVGSQLSRTAHISRVLSVKTPGEQNDVLEFSMSVQNAYASLIYSLQFDVSVPHWWRHNISF